MRIGDKVTKNQQTWIASDFDSWGAGEGVGIVDVIDDELVDVKWPTGRCSQRTTELLLVPEVDS